MTEPVSYVPKTPPSVQAMYYDGSHAANAAIANWMHPLLSEQGSVYPGPLGRPLYVVDGSSMLTIEPGCYVYLEGGAFKVIEQGAFELMMKIDDGL